MSSAHRATTGDCLTAKALATRMGISPKRVRAILRAECPREAKAKAEEGEGKRKTIVEKESKSG